MATLRSSCGWRRLEEDSIKPRTLSSKVSVRSPQASLEIRTRIPFPRTQVITDYQPQNVYADLVCANSALLKGKNRKPLLCRFSGLP